jgi:selenide, water dikinase
LIGGHTTEGGELAFGLACNGLVEPQKLLQKQGMKSGDRLILTKAIGTGTLLAADMQYKAKGRWIDNAIESMLLSNQTAAKIFLENGATACTDITGFGLIGHLIEMLKNSNLSVVLTLETIPILEGARETIEQKIMSSLQPQNLKAAAYIETITEVTNYFKYPLLFDPQTSGGLLATVPSENSDRTLKKLQNSGYKDSQIIGFVSSANSNSKPIKITIDN